MNWIWIIVGIVAVLAITITIIVIVKSCKKKRETPGIAEMNRGFDKFKKSLERQNADIDAKLDASQLKLTKLNEEAAEVASKLEGQHDEIDNADDWDDLNRIAGDIERQQ